MSAPGFCAVCGRTFLVGERVRPYVSAEGRHEVCELCAERTENLGWLPADQDGAEERVRADASRRSGLLGKLFSRPGRQDPVEAGHDTEDDWFDDEDPMPAPRRAASRQLDPPSPSRTSHDLREPSPDASDDFERPPRGASHDLHPPTGPSHDLEQPNGPSREPELEPPVDELDTERYDVEAEWRDDRPSETERDAGPIAEADVEPPAARPNPLRRLADLLAPASPSDDLERESVDPRTNLEAVRERGGPPTPAPVSPPKNERPAETQPGVRPDPAGRGMRPRRLQPDLSPSTRFERAIVRFNAGEAGRTVAGLTRTLGAPSVSVGDLAGVDEVVRVTVAWELTWYQWGVDLGDELRPVYELAKGFEVGEIDAAARQWNASAHDGRIVMIAPARRAAENGRPVHHR